MAIRKLKIHYKAQK